MKGTERIFKIFIICIVLQLIITLFSVNNVYAAPKPDKKGGGSSSSSSTSTTSDKGFFEGVFEQGKEWKEMGEENAKEIEEGEGKGVFDTLKEVYRVARIVGASLFIGGIGIVGVGLIMDFKETGAKIAESKTTLIFMTVLAFLFIFAEQILTFVSDLFNMLENTI